MADTANGSLPVHRHRALLARTLEKLRGPKAELTVGFIGGSITAEAPRNCWPDAVVSWFHANFPGVRLTIENAAIGATGSDLACFRAKSQLIERQCDLVFVEFAVNDGGEPTGKRMRTREGLLRQLLAGEGRDVVITYTYGQDFYQAMMDNTRPASIAEFEQLAEHYNIGSVWMSLHALREVQAGQMRWEEWLPDGLHPQQRGSLVYGQAVGQFLTTELLTKRKGDKLAAGNARPAAFDAGHWEKAAALPWAEVKWTGPWALRRWPHDPWMGQVLETAAPGARLRFDFIGRGLNLGLAFGKLSADFRYRLDGGEWKTMNLDRPWWCGNGGWFRLVPLGDDLPATASGVHRFELEVIHGNRENCNGTTMQLALIGVIQ